MKRLVVRSPHRRPLYRDRESANHLILDRVPSRARFDPVFVSETCSRQEDTSDPVEDGDGDGTVRDIVISRSLAEHEAARAPVDVAAILRMCKEEAWRGSSDASGGDAAACECPICLEALEPNETILRLPCDHVFHRGCIVPWIEGHHDQCPVCRARILIDADAASRHRHRSPSSNAEVTNDRELNLAPAHAVPIIGAAATAAAATAPSALLTSSATLSHTPSVYDVPVMASPTGGRRRRHQVSIATSPVDDRPLEPPPFFSLRLVPIDRAMQPSLSVPFHDPLHPVFPRNQHAIPAASTASTASVARYSSAGAASMPSDDVLGIAFDAIKTLFDRLHLM